jgi:FlaA1/EpsC-like NDP-sugar epimerase
MTLHCALSRLLALPPSCRRYLLIAADLLVIPLAVWLSFALRLADPWPAQLRQCSWMFADAWLIAPAMYGFSGQYKGITRYAGSSAFYALSLRNLAVVLLLSALGWLLPLTAPPRSSWLLLWLLLTGLTGLLRLLLRDLLLQAQARSSRRSQVTALIYGAGDAGMQLASALRYAHSHRLLAFVDDDPNLWGRHINGLAVVPPQRLPGLIARETPSQILLAMPLISRSRRRRILDDLQPYGIPVLQVPSVEEISAGRTRIDALRPIAIEELLGRDPVEPDPQLLAASVRGRCVLVSGAGGSIGAELCRQILALGPERLILLERSEPALYAIDQELRRCQAAAPAPASPPAIQPVLGSVGDQALLDRLLRRQQVHTVFHAAAYKHVPLVEANMQQGLLNNVAGTWALARAVAGSKVSTSILVSTDKAVRPTNVMGASKRIAELVLQGIAHATSHPFKPTEDPGPVTTAGAHWRSPTRLSMVRFGNVLGSSGSVIPLFRSQIAHGGPVTVTHPEVTRYFMTIAEAAQLVLQAGAMAEGADVFVLDMGEPIKIFELARRMVTLAGHSLRDQEHPGGDIEITFTGLRPGEKLYEELLIGDNPMPTAHPRILRALEERLPWPVLHAQLQALHAAVKAGDEAGMRQLLHRLVPGYQPDAAPSEA